LLLAVYARMCKATWNDVVWMKTHKANDDDRRRRWSFLWIDGRPSAGVARPPARRDDPTQSRLLSRYGVDRGDVPASSARPGRRRSYRGRTGCTDRAHRDGINHGDARDGKSRQIVAMDTSISGRDGCAQGGPGLLCRLPARE